MINEKQTVEVIVQAMRTMAEGLIKKASFDKSSIGVITQKNGSIYTVKAFGSHYDIESSLLFSVNQKVAVVAPQNNFSKLYMIAI